MRERKWEGIRNKLIRWLEVFFYISIWEIVRWHLFFKVGNKKSYEQKYLKPLENHWLFLNSVDILRYLKPLKKSLFIHTFRSFFSIWHLWKSPCSDILSGDFLFFETSDKVPVSSYFQKVFLVLETSAKSHYSQLLLDISLYSHLVK